MAMNILLLIADDHRYESIGANGCSEILTPHLDALAASGVSFDGAHCQGGMHPAVCAPSRASLLTGRNIFASSQDPSGLDFGGRAFAIPSAMPTIPERLQAAGYHTHAIGKWHNDRAAFARSFTSASRVMFGGMSDHDRVPLHDFDPSGRYPKEAATFEEGLSTDLFREAANDFLRDHDGKKPFFLQVAFTAPHDPRTPPPRHVVPPDRVSLPPNLLPAHPFDTGEMLVRDELLEAIPRLPEAVLGHIADYYGMVQHLDEAIGGIMKTLERLGLRDDTLVVYTSDHGIALGQHGLMGKQNLYEHSVRVSLIVAGEGIPAGRRVPHLLWHADTAATLLDSAGLPSDPAMEGFSLLPLARGETVSPLRETTTAVHCVSQRMVRDARHKLICYLPNPDAPMQPAAAGRTSRGSLTEQLFDLEADPVEMVNLASRPDMQAIRTRLVAHLLRWQQNVGDPLAELTRDALIGKAGTGPLPPCEPSPQSSS